MKYSTKKKYRDIIKPEIENNSESSLTPKKNILNTSFNFIKKSLGGLFSKK